jgi:hypothetical protein
MATRKRSIKRRNNNTKKRRQIGGSLQCTYDKSSKKLHITIARGMLDGNLSAIRSACENAIRESSPEKAVKKHSKEKVVKQSSPEKAVKKHSKEKVVKQSSPKQSSSRAHGNKKTFHNFPTSESLTSDIGVYDGRRSHSEE